MDVLPPPWVTTDEQRERRERHARELVGRTISAVRYFDIDHHRSRNARPDEVIDGDRWVTDRQEWERPSWQADGFHAIDFGVELETSDRATFTAAWDMLGRFGPPEMYEALSFRRGTIREVVRGGGYPGAFAIWDVGRRSRWTRFLDEPIEDVELFWAPWPDALVCGGVALRTGSDSVYLVLGQADANGELVLAADKVAVAFGESDARRFGVGPYRRLP